MKLYFNPLACSMAARIALYEAGAAAEFVQVDTRRKLLPDGSDYRNVNPMGQVPVLETDTGARLTENVVVLRHLGEAFDLAPRDASESVSRWLSFIATELHKLVFIPLLDRTSNDGAREYARAKATPRFDYLQAHLEGRAYLLDRFSVADAYLVTVLNWAGFAGLDLADWPAVQAYLQRLRARPSVSRAMDEEFALYRQAAA